MEKISWIDRARNGVLHRVKRKRYIVQTVKRREANWIGHMLCGNCLLKHIIKGKVIGRTEVTGRLGKRRKQQLDDFTEKRGYWKMKEKAVDRSVWRIGFVRTCGPVVCSQQQTASQTAHSYKGHKCEVPNCNPSLPCQFRNTEIYKKKHELAPNQDVCTLFLTVGSTCGGWWFWQHASTPYTPKKVTAPN